MTLPRSPKLPEHIVLFDGVCNVCNKAVQTVIRNDNKGTFHYASLQSALGQELLEKHGIDKSSIDSVVYVRGEKAFTHSAAALRIATKMDGLYPLASVFLIVPWFVRDMVYNLIARNRYKWFGKRDSCMLPTPEQRTRFIDLEPVV